MPPILVFHTKKSLENLRLGDRWGCNSWTALSQPPQSRGGPAPALHSLPIHSVRLCWKLQQSGGFKAWVCAHLLEHFPHFINHSVPGHIVDSQTLFQLQRVGLLSCNILRAQQAWPWDTLTRGCVTFTSFADVAMGGPHTVTAVCQSPCLAVLYARTSEAPRDLSDLLGETRVLTRSGSPVLHLPGYLRWLTFLPPPHEVE